MRTYRCRDFSVPTLTFTRALRESRGAPGPPGRSCTFYVNRSILKRSFRRPDTERLFQSERVARFVNIESAARRRLGMLHFASELRELLTPPGNRLEPLKGDRIGQHSIRINDQYRVCFR